mgnify:CR=1 FL=1
MGQPEMLRKERSKKYASWQEEYNAKLCSAEDAAAAIVSNDRIAMSGGTSLPPGFSHALSKRAGDLKNVQLYMGYAMGLYDYMKPENKESFQIETVFVGPMERVCMEWGMAQYVPIHLGDTANFSRSRKVTVSASVVTPPDEDGYMNRSCFASFLDKKTIANSEKVVVEVNRETPWLNSEDFKIHISEVDYIIENHGPIFEVPEIVITDTEKKIAENIIDLIPDGSTIQLGFGGLGNAIGHLLVTKKDLGMHSEVISPSVQTLVEKGVINCSKKTFHPGLVVGGFCVGTRPFYDYINRNEKYLFKEIGYVNNIINIGKNDNLVSINNALMMDLTGQAASESMGSKQYSGTGGQVNFVIGSRFSRGGRSIMALNSTYTDKEGTLHSKIVSAFPPLTTITTSRNDVQYVVTEFGVANLRYKNIAQRAREMIAIAHPDFRDTLAFEAHKAGWL